MKSMRLVLAVLLAISFTIAFVGCGGDDDEGTPELEVSTNMVNLGSSMDPTNVKLDNVGDATLEWEVETTTPWLRFNDDSGDIEAEDYFMLEVSADHSGMADGTYTGDFTIASNGGEETVMVSMEVATPYVGISVAVINFDPDESTATFQVSNIGTGTLNWSLSTSDSWINVSPTSGTATTESDMITVTVNRSGMALGEHSGHITVTGDLDYEEVQINMQVGEELGSFSMDSQFLMDISWSSYDNNNINGEDYWGSSSARALDGGGSAYCADRGDQSGTYDDFMEAWLTLDSPRDASSYSEVTIEFDIWYSTENNYDDVSFIAHATGSTWYTNDNYIWTDESDGWEHISIPLSDFPSANQDAVRIGFLFESDGSVNEYEGVYVDNIVIYGR